MNKKIKRLLAAIVVLALLAGALILIYLAFFRPPPPEVTAVEGIIPEGPDALIITRNMANLWEAMGEDTCIADARILSLLDTEEVDLTPITGSVSDYFSLEDISPELLFYLLGYESACAVYPPKGDDPEILFVSRVHPAVVFLEQFIIFIDEESHIDRVSFGDLTVREVSTDGDGPSLFYTFDDDLLVFSTERGLFDTALNLLAGGAAPSAADEKIHCELGRFRPECACVWGYFRGGLIDGDGAASILMRILKNDGDGNFSPLFFATTWDEDSLMLTAAGGDTPRPPSAAPRLEYADEELLSVTIGEGLPAVGGENGEALSRLFPSGCFVSLLTGDAPGVLHPVVWGAAGPDTDSMLKAALEESGAPTSRFLVDDISVTSGVSHGAPMAYTIGDGLLIIGRNENDLLTHRRFMGKNAVDPTSHPDVLIAAHLTPGDLVDASAGEDALTSLLSAVNCLWGADAGGDAPSYRELADALAAWETADAVAWTDDGQVSLVITLSRKGDLP